MAYIIRSDLRYRLGKTEIGYFDDDRQVIRTFFDEGAVRPGTIVRPSWFSGLPLPSEVMPHRLRLTKGKAMYDWLDLRSGGTLVSSQLRDAVEELDPGRHQFFPVAIEDKGGVAVAGEFFIFNVVGRIEAIIEERSNLKASGRDHIATWGYERRVGPWRCALDASVIGDRACWVEHRYGECWFISDRLAVLLSERKLSGYEVDEQSDEVTP